MLATKTAGKRENVLMVPHQYGSVSVDLKKGVIVGRKESNQNTKYVKLSTQE